MKGSRRCTATPELLEKINRKKKEASQISGAGWKGNITDGDDPFVADKWLDRSCRPGKSADIFRRDVHLF